MMRAIVSIYLWFLYGVSFALSFFIGGFLYLFTFWQRPVRPLVNAVQMAMGGTIVLANPFYKREVYGREKLRKNSTTIFVANHQSFLDMPFIARLPLNLFWTSKSSLFKVPFAGWNLWMSGHVAIHRSKRSVFNDIRKTIPILKKGHSVIFFPEGTRSQSGELKNFKKGAFVIAWESNTPLQPLLVEGTNEAMPPGNWMLNPKGRFKLKVLDALHPADYSSVDELMAATEQAMRTALQELREQ